MTELATHERVRTPTTTVAIRRLEKLGLVKRSRDPSDLRAVLVNVTPRGLVQHREALEARRQVLSSMLAKLTPDEVECIAKALAPLEKLDSRSSHLSRQPSQSNTEAAVHDCCMLPSGSPVNGS